MSLQKEYAELLEEMALATGPRHDILKRKVREFQTKLKENGIDSRDIIPTRPKPKE